jgi:L-fucose mutarotase/ribose pyranase (RbsD/FucU family)
MRRIGLVLPLAVFFFVLLPVPPTRGQPQRPERVPEWRQRLRATLPRLGHRNWVVVVDAAYPEQVAPGIETIVTGADHLDVVKAVLADLDGQAHVRPVVHLDRELESVPERYARGIREFRGQLKDLLRGRDARAAPHEEIIARLDQAGKTFRVVVLKTNLTLPYTSVFLELDCAYWGRAAEKALRDVMGPPGRRP